MRISSLLLTTLTAVGFGLGLSAATQAQDFPTRAIRIVVPFTAGSATDILGRTVAEKLNAAWGQPVVVENRPGAGGTIGAALVAKAPPDGYTVLVVSAGHVVNPELYPNLSYDTINDFAGVIPLGHLPSVLVVGSGSPIKSVQELLAAARAKPGALNFATAGVGSATHVNAEKFRAATGIQIAHIPFKGTPETITETVSGRVDFMFTPMLSSLPMIRDGRLRALAVSTAHRSPALANVPTVAESGVPGFEFNFWIGLLAPAKTPREIVIKLNREIARVLQLPEVQERMNNLGAEMLLMSPEQFDTYLREEYASLGKVMRDAGAKAKP